MKFCFIGLGSIGKRHLYNLMQVLERRGIEYQIDALRSRRKALELKWNDAICQHYYCIDSLPDDYDVIFITNPTSLHYDTLMKVIEKTKHLFIEKPVFDHVNYDMNALPLKKGNIYYVACPLRHKAIIKSIKEMVSTGEKVISARIISTSYLPSWREGVDYRTLYSAKREMGGGVTRDLIHEWDYARYLFGDPNKVIHLAAHTSDLEISSDDISVYIASYPDMLLEIHLDYFGQKTERLLQIFTSRKRIDADLINNVICEYKNNKLVNRQEFFAEDLYVNEMEYFLDCLEEKCSNMNSIVDAYHTLRIALTGE